MQRSILLIDDEPDMLFVLKDAFRKEGYTVYSADSAEDGIKSFVNNSPNIIISDVMMPGMNGIEMVNTIRKINQTVPILFLTSKVGVEDAVNGLNIGANDYIRKPFSTTEVVARVNAFLRSPEKETQEIQTIGQLSYNPVTRTLTGGPKDIKLTGKEAAILELLAKNLNETVNSKDLMTRIWGNTDYFTSRCMHVHIANIKKYLSPDPDIKIINERSVGYKLVVAAEQPSDKS